MTTACGAGGKIKNPQQCWGLINPLRCGGKNPLQCKGVNDKVNHYEKNPQQCWGLITPLRCRG